MRLGRWAGVCVVAIFALALGQAWAACGNGVIEAGEECDDGSQNGGTNSCCQSNCLLSGKAPDVIVGELVGTLRHGNSGGITAYSVGTTSCNLGSCWLNWIANSDNKPVIGQNMFRLKDGRFEQVGQAWLKHGFTALQQTACSTGCVPAPNGSHLGVLCSDPYDASLNGSQTRLGPKENVNPGSGTYLYPDARIALTGNAIYKRLQVHDTDLNPATNAGAVYFVEGQYVTKDDAQAKNQGNNASYRQVLVGAAPNFSLTLTSSTQRQKAGIEAWKATDATVTQTGTNGFILAAKATSLGGGVWHYEYAVQNLTNDRGGQSFTVPIQPGAVRRDRLDAHGHGELGAMGDDALRDEPERERAALGHALQLPLRRQRGTGQRLRHDRFVQARRGAEYLHRDASGRGSLLRRPRRHGLQRLQRVHGERRLSVGALHRRGGRERDTVQRRQRLHADRRVLIRSVRRSQSGDVLGAGFLP